MDMFPNKEPAMSTRYYQLISFALIPIEITAFSYGFWAVYGRCKDMPPQTRSDYSAATMIIILFVFYPTIVTILAKSLNCI